MSGVSLNDLYRAVPLRVKKSLGPLNGCHYQHVPEVELDNIPNDHDETKTPNMRVTRRILWFKREDFRRYWELATVWLDNRPVMVVKNAGREGDDHHGRFITDPEAYTEMVAYLHTIIPVEPPTVDISDANEPRDDLLHFYYEGVDRLDMQRMFPPDGAPDA